MDEHNPVTEKMKASDARQQFSEIINRVFREEARIVVERSGIPVAAIVSVKDLARLERYEREQEGRFAGLSRISEAFADVPVEKLLQEVDRAVLDRDCRRQG